MKTIRILLLLISVFSFAQNKKMQLAEIRHFQEALNDEYRNPKETPLRGENLTAFTSHPFFAADLKYRVKAKFIKTENPQPFEIPTSSGRSKTFLEYGKATFSLDGKTYTLRLYQNLKLAADPKHADDLFLPFRDETNGKETYGGGKYLDLKIPKGKMIVIDFNQSYQPYCAYNAYDYHCPIVPEENWLPVRIEAGVKYDNVYFH